MHDEKFPSVHVAHGHGYPKQTGAVHYESKVHYDGVIIRPNVFDLETGRTIMIRGEYKI
jgi:hypothetical protein